MCIVDVIKYSRCMMYADDVKIFNPIDSICDSIHMQYDLDSIENLNNRLSLNIFKCKIVSYQRKARSEINHELIYTTNGNLRQIKFSYYAHIEHNM